MTLHDSVKAAVSGRVDRASESFGMLVLELPPDHLVDLVRQLKDEFAFDLFLDVTAVDHPGREPRFDLVYHFLSPRHRRRVRLKLAVGGEPPTVPTLTPLYGSARYMEREVHDMYGVRFAGNDDLRPILLYEGFEGHPLRKDYPIDLEQPIVAYRK